MQLVEIQQLRCLVQLFQRSERHAGALEAAYFLGIGQGNKLVRRTLVLYNGANIEATGGIASTELHIVVEKSNPEILSLLFSSSARLNVNNSQRFSPGINPAAQPMVAR